MCLVAHQKSDASISQQHSEGSKKKTTQKINKKSKWFKILITCHWLSWGKLKQGNYTAPKRNTQLF